MLSKRDEKLIAAAVAIEEEDAKEAGMIGYMVRAMVLATMPINDPKTTHYQRKNGNLTLTMAALDTNIGLPFGSLPRLIMAWLGREAVRTKSRTIVLGSSLSDFLKQLDLYRTGGKRGDITRLRDQMTRLFSTAISANYSDNKRTAMKNVVIVREADLWWDTKEIHQAGLWESTVTLGEDFYNELLLCPIPIDVRALKALKSSPMAIDIYTWRTYRNTYLKKPTLIPWKGLHMQFGAEYKLTKHFKADFLKNLKKVLIVYPESRQEVTDKGLIILPSMTHVSR
ncbi:MAG: pirin [Desulfuromonadales bacterium]|nr:pirin [Desulfuromonadales bacterium]